MQSNQTKSMLSSLLALTVLCGCWTGLTSRCCAQETQEATAKVSPETQALHDKLSKYLSGTKWTGNFTMGNGKQTTEYYEILSAEKSEYGDQWNLIARIKYGGKDMTFPLPPIDIKFAGKTPVITVDKVFFPGFGTFDARVVIRRGKYAGTWQHDKVGGHLFGTIERMSEEELKASQGKVERPETKQSATDKTTTDKDPSAPQK